MRYAYEPTAIARAEQLVLQSRQAATASGTAAKTCNAALSCGSSMRTALGECPCARARLIHLARSVLSTLPGNAVSYSSTCREALHRLTQSVVLLWETYHAALKGSMLQRNVAVLIDALRQACCGDPYVTTSADAVSFSVPSSSVRPVTRVVMTITTCKRLPLFLETVRALMHNWKDFALVDRVVCVDDNSSEPDRRAMVRTFPWMQFRMKSAEEKGHRRSMNIIVDEVLRVHRPEFWIQMEDDWFFHKEDAYVTRCTEALTRLRDGDTHRVRQIVLNRNYEEKYDWNDSQPHVDLGKGVLLHTHIAHQRPSHTDLTWWPHFSLNPSFVDAGVIVDECGAFQGPECHFEARYAHKYHYRHNYKTAYLDQISCTNIGKLRGDVHAPNAYTLNGTQQY